VGKKLGYLTNVMKATSIEFISIDHQYAMTTENDSVSMANYRLTKGDAAPPGSKKSNLDNAL